MIDNLEGFQRDPGGDWKAGPKWLEAWIDPHGHRVWYEQGVPLLDLGDTDARGVSPKYSIEIGHIIETKSPRRP